MDPHTSLFAAALLFLSSALIPALHDPTVTNTTAAANITDLIPSTPGPANLSGYSSSSTPSPLPSPDPIPPSLLQHRDIIVRYLTHHHLTPSVSSNHNNSNNTFTNNTNHHDDNVLPSLSPDTTYPSPVSRLHAFVATPFMRDYLRIHAAAMCCFRNASCYRSSKAASVHPPLLVWACPARRCKGTGDRLRGILSALSVAVLSRRVFLVDWPDQPFPLVHAVAPGALDWRMPPHVHADVHQDNSNDKADDNTTGSNSSSSKASKNSQRKARAKWGRLDDHWYPVFKWSVCPGLYTCLNESSSASKTKMKGKESDDEEKKEGIHIISETFNVSNIASVLQSINAHVVLPTHGTYSSRLYRLPEWRARVASASRSNHTGAKPKKRHVGPSPLDMHRMLLRVLFRPSPVTAVLLRDVVPYTDVPSPKTKVQLWGKKHTINDEKAMPKKTKLDKVRFEPYIAVHARTGRDVGERNMIRFRGLSGLTAPTLAARFARCVTHFDDVMSSISPALSPSNETLSNNSSSKSTDAVHHIVFVSDSFDVKNSFASTMSNLSNGNENKSLFSVHYSTYRGLHLSTPATANVYAYAKNHTPGDSVSEEEAIGLLHDQRWLRFIHVFVDFFALVNGTDVVANPSEFSRLAFTMSDARRYVTFNVTDDRAACAAVRRLGSMREDKHSGVEALIYAKQATLAKEKNRREEEARKSG